MRRDFINIVGLFLGWKILIILLIVLAINMVPLASKDRYLGGGFINYNLSPQIFSLANFDGEHFLSISIFGYKPLEYAFFPVYPFLISIIAAPISTDFVSRVTLSTIVGATISSLSFLIGLILLFDLLRLDYSRKVAYLTLMILLVFPTSFYFNAVYSESIFLLLVVASFYSARKGHWLLAGILGGIASGARVFGVLLLPALIIEAWQTKRSLKEVIWLAIIPLVLILYMYYSWTKTGDPIIFYHLQKTIGEQHQEGIILIPQVVYRYLKILLTFDKQNPLYQTVVLEFVTGILFFLLPIYGYLKKVRLSYLFFAFFGYLIPTIQGSFSSTPRYILVLFPSFLVLGLLLSNSPRIFRVLVLVVFLIILSIEFVLFSRGFWVS